MCSTDLWVVFCSFANLFHNFWTLTICAMNKILMVVLLRRRMYHATVTQSDSVDSSPPTVGVVEPSASIHVHVRQTVLHPGPSSSSSADKSATGDGRHGGSMVCMCEDMHMRSESGFGYLENAIEKPLEGTAQLDDRSIKCLSLYITHDGRHKLLCVCAFIKKMFGGEALTVYLSVSFGRLKGVSAEGSTLFPSASPN